MFIECSNKHQTSTKLQIMSNTMSHSISLYLFPFNFDSRKILLYTSMELLENIKTAKIIILTFFKDTEIAEEASSQLLSEQNPNIVVPSFDILPRQSTWASLGFTIGKIARSWHILSDGNVRQRCLYQRGPEETLHKISNGGQKPIRVLIVGVHGFFPTKMIRPFIGEPTGTSMKFVSEAEQVVLKYFQKHKDVSRSAR